MTQLLKPTTSQNNQSSFIALFDQLKLKDYDSFCSSIQNRDSLYKADQFLQYFNLKNNVNTKLLNGSRLLFTAIMMAQFPVLVFDESKQFDIARRRLSDEDDQLCEIEDSCDRQCCKAATDLVKRISDCKQNPDETEYSKQLLNDQKLFYKAFEDQKENDKRKMLRILTNNYTQTARSLQHIRENVSENLQTHFETGREQLEKSLRFQRERIIKLGGKEFFDDFIERLEFILSEQRQNDQQIFHSSTSTSRNKDEKIFNEKSKKTSSSADKSQRNSNIKMIKLDEIVFEEASKLYQNEFRVELMNKNFNRLFKLLDEISSRIKKLIPHRKDLQQNFDAELDLDLCRQHILTETDSGEDRGISAFNCTDFIKIFDIIWAWISRLNPPISDRGQQEQHDDVHDRIEMADSSNNSNVDLLPDLLPAIFNRFLAELDRLEDICNEISAITNTSHQNGSNPPPNIPVSQTQTNLSSNKQCQQILKYFYNV